MSIASLSEPRRGWSNGSRYWFPRQGAMLSSSPYFFATIHRVHIRVSGPVADSAKRKISFIAMQLILRFTIVLCHGTKKHKFHTETGTVIEPINELIGS